MCMRTYACAHTQTHRHRVTKCCSGKFCQTRMVDTRNVTDLDKQENLHQTSVLMSGSTVSPTSPEIPHSELSPSLLWGTSSHLQHSQFPASMDFLLKGRNTVHTQTRSTHKGINQHLKLKYLTQIQQQRPESPTVTLTWHVFTHKQKKQMRLINWKNSFLLQCSRSDKLLCITGSSFLVYFCSWCAVLTCVLSVYPHDHQEEETESNICLWATLCANTVHHWRSHLCHHWCSNVVKETQQKEESPIKIEK